MKLFTATVGMFALATALATSAATSEPDPEAYAERDGKLVAQALASLPRQRPGILDLYAVGFAGDGTENVFRNEIEYFVRMSRQRLRARGTIPLVSHPASLLRRPLPLATYRNLRLALSGLGQVMDPDEDVLLLYMSMHGTPEHELVLYYPPLVEDILVPDDLKVLLDESGIRNKVVVISACYAGGFIPLLQSPDTMLITAARDDQPSFGCGTASNITWFGRAWMVEGLSRSIDFKAAFKHATTRVSEWEREADFEASDPQLKAGAAIDARLESWRSQTEPGPPLDYPLPVEPVEDAPAQGSASISR